MIINLPISLSDVVQSAAVLWQEHRHVNIHIHIKLIPIAILLSIKISSCVLGIHSFRSSSPFVHVHHCVAAFFKWLERFSFRRFLRLCRRWTLCFLNALKTENVDGTTTINARICPKPHFPMALPSSVGFRRSNNSPDTMKYVNRIA